MLRYLHLSAATARLHLNACRPTTSAIFGHGISRSNAKFELFSPARPYASDGKRKGPSNKTRLSDNSPSIKRPRKLQETPPNNNNNYKTIVQIRTSASASGDGPPRSITLPTGPTEPPHPIRSQSTSNPKPRSPPPDPRRLFKVLAIAALGISAFGLSYYMGWLDSDRKGHQHVKHVKKTEEKKPGWKPRPVLRYPAEKEAFPERVPYVLIGGGTASFAAFRAIKSMDPTAKVLVISAEDSIPYMRPPLSKEMWQQKQLPPIDNLNFLQWNGQERSLYYEPAEFYLDIRDLMTAEHGGVALATGWVVSKVDAATNTVMLEDPTTGTEFPIRYDKCLIATGSTPKRLPLFERASQEVKQKTVLLRNIRDLEDLWYKLEEANSVAIIGGGFLGSELACSLGRRFKAAKKGKGKVYQLFRESGNMGKVLPEYLSKWTTLKVANEGVDVVSEAEVKDVKMDNKQVSLSLSNGETVKADIVVVAVGAEACTQLAEPSNLEVDPNLGGFLVNAELEARSNLFVAGDASCFYDPILGRRRVEHHDHAVVSGRLAGENMAGAAKPYKHQSMFWSDLGPDVGYEAIGLIDSELPTVAVFAKKSQVSPVDENHPTTTEAVDPETNPFLDAVKSEKGVDPIKSILSEEAPAIKSEKTQAKSEKASNPNESVVVDSLDYGGARSEDDYSKGVIFYLKNQVIVGIVLWNVFNRMHTARRVLAERKKHEDLNEVAKLFYIHEVED